MAEPDEAHGQVQRVNLILCSYGIQGSLLEAWWNKQRPELEGLSPLVAWDRHHMYETVSRLAESDSDFVEWYTAHH